MDTIRTAKLMRVGNSLAVVIPKNILRDLKFERGDQFVFAVYADNTIVMRKLTPQDIAKLKPLIIQ